MASPLSPTDLLEPLGIVEAELAPGIDRVEVYTAHGLLGLTRFGPRLTDRVVVACTGGMGGMLGPGEAMYPAIGRRLAHDGIATVVVDYRRPSRLELCVLDAVAAVDLAAQRGAARVVAIGHSFGGAVAINLGLALPSAVAGVCTLSTQSAGCEGAAGLAPRPFLLIHGALDEILPAESSSVVQALAGGHGTVEILDDEGHGLNIHSESTTERVSRWTTEVFSART